MLRVVNGRRLQNSECSLRHSVNHDWFNEVFKLSELLVSHFPVWAFSPCKSIALYVLSQRTSHYKNVKVPLWEKAHNVGGFQLC